VIKKLASQYPELFIKTSIRLEKYVEMLAFISEYTATISPFYYSDFKLLSQHYQNLMADVNFCIQRTLKGGF